MPQKTLEQSGEVLTISRDALSKAVPGFIKLHETSPSTGQLAKAIASAFLKYTKEGEALSSEDSVQSFIAQADLHRALTEDAVEFLKKETPYIYEDQPLHHLLLSFAAFRLTQASRKFYYATFQNMTHQQQSTLKKAISYCQEAYDTLLQSD